MANPKRPRISIDVNLELQRRIRVAAAHEGESVSEFCLRAIEERLKSRDIAAPASDLERVRQAIETARELRRRVFGGRLLETSSAELIRQAREERTAQLP